MPQGSIVVTVKVYRNYQQLIRWNEQKITWVSRLNARAVYKVTELNELNIYQQAQGVQQDTVFNFGNSNPPLSIPYKELG